MKVLKAPTPITVNRITSVGTVKFVEGIATEFTEAQAAHLQKISGAYKVIELDDLDDLEASEKTPEETTEDIKVKIAFAKSEEEKRLKKAEDDEKTKRNEEQEKAVKTKQLEDKKKADADRLRQEAIDKKAEDDRLQQEKDDEEKAEAERLEKEEKEKKAIKIPDENTPYPRLVEMVKKFEIPTPNGRNAGELLKAILADEHFKKPEATE